MPALPDRVDVVIVGGGPAGLSAALVLGRCRRNVVVFDAGRPRNAPSRAVHGFLGNDGDDPAVVVARARADVARYGVAVVDDVVTAVGPDADGGGYVVASAAHGSVRCDKLILATGVRDKMPPLSSSPTFDDLLGKGVYVCPYCDGWEHKDEPLVVVGTAALAPDLGMAMTAFSDDVTVVCRGVAAEAAALLARNGVKLIDDEVVALGEADGHLSEVRLAGGAVLRPGAVFVHAGVEQASPLPASLGCAIDEKSGLVHTGRAERSGPPGVFVVGDASEDLTLVAVAVAEGVRAACAVHTALRKERQR